MNQTVNPMRVAVKIQLSNSDHRKLKQWSRSRCVASRLQECSQIVLMAANGKTNKDIAQSLEIDKNKVGRWRNRFASEGIEGIMKERPRGGNHGGKCSKRQAKLRQEVTFRTTQTKPSDATHWSI